MRRLLEHAWVDGEVRSNVLVEVAGGRFARVEPDAAAAAAPDDAVRVPGLTLPGVANAHSHAFHRALRGRTQTGRGTFWTWREQMYSLAERLDPDGYFELASAAYAEMVAAGYTSVGEFHYLHHAPDGTPYADHAMTEALLAAASAAGIRITLLDTCYLSSGFGAAPSGAQVRYSDGHVEKWCERVDALAPRVAAHPHARLGVAIHSVRAVPPEAVAVIADFAATRDMVLHAHVSEQPAENVDCLTAHQMTPTQLLAEAGALSTRTSLVHATHLSAEDIATIGAAGAYACFCPTTERDLGDGIGPGRALVAAGAVLTIGSDSHAVVDPFEELRAVEMDERLASIERGHWSAAELLHAGTVDGHASIDWSDAGAIAVGQRADLVTLDLTSPRTAGTGGGAEAAVFAASAADVRQVMVDGRVVYDGDSAAVGRQLGRAIERAIERVHS